MIRITKKEWDALGGLKNSDLARVMHGGRWYYYKGATS